MSSGMDWCSRRGLLCGVVCEHYMLSGGWYGTCTVDVVWKVVWDVCSVRGVAGGMGCVQYMSQLQEA